MVGPRTWQTVFGCPAGLILRTLNPICYTAVLTDMLHTGTEDYILISDVCLLLINSDGSLPSWNIIHHGSISVIQVLWSFLCHGESLLIELTEESTVVVVGHCWCLNPRGEPDTSRYFLIFSTYWVLVPCLGAVQYEPDWIIEHMADAFLLLTLRYMLTHVQWHPTCSVLDTRRHIPFKCGTIPQDVLMAVSTSLLFAPIPIFFRGFF